MTAEDRVRQVLQQGYTYQTHLKGSIRGPAENKNWAIKTVVEVIYTFEAFIDREIVSNDGATIVEVRRFKDVKSLDIHGKLQDVKIDLGPAGKALYAGLLFIDPAAAEIVRFVDGLSLRPVLKWLDGLQIEKHLGIDDKLAEAFAKVDSLSGKVVRMEYVDGKGVVDLRDEPGSKTMTVDERTFHNASILLSDALIFPYPEIAVGKTWAVDGRVFNHLIDPSLRASVAGVIKFVRLADEERSGKKMRVVGIVKPARFTLEGSDKDEGRVGHAEPEGKMYFSPADQVIVEAELSGSGQLERFSKNHLLFETAFRGRANLKATYFCRPVKTDTLLKNARTSQP